MKILVTGASGFVGNHILNYLTQNFNFKVIATSRNKEKAHKKIWFKKVDFLEVDLSSNQADWYEFFHKPDLLIHLAWANLPNYNDTVHLTENLPNQINFLENILDKGLKNISISGTCFEYGLQEGELFEDMPTFPNNPYGIAKDTLRRYIEFKSKLLKINFKWLRLFYMYGDGQNPNSLIPQLHKAIANGESFFKMSSGQQKRDYLSVENVAKYIVEASLKKDLNGIINISSGTPVTLIEFLTKYINSINKQIDFKIGYYPYPKHEPMEFWGNNNKIKFL